MLLNAGANPDAFGELSDRDETALLLASANGHVEIVRLLLEAKADKSLAGRCGETALVRAACKGHAEIVRLLLKAGVEKDSANTDSDTALLRASQNGHVETARSLLAAGADGGWVDKTGDTALICAARRGYAGIVEILLESDAGKHLADSCSEGPWDVFVPFLASRGIFFVIVFQRVLRAILGYSDTALIHASDGGHVETTKLLLEARRGRAMVDKCGDIALFRGCCRGPRLAETLNPKP